MPTTGTATTKTNPYSPPVGGVISLCSLSIILMADTQTYTNYAQFNTVTVTGRIFHSEVPKGRDFLSVSVISTLTKDGQEVEFTFTNSNGLKSLFEKGFLSKGRVVTITGHIATCGETYQKDGETHLRKRPQIHMTGVQILDGGLGPAPIKDSEAKPVASGRRVITHKTAPVDATPALEPVEAEAGLY